MQSQYFLGIDGGGSKTEAVIIDDTEKVLGVGLSGGCNTTFTTKEVGVASFTTSISQALAEAALGSDVITAAGCTFGMAAREAFKELGIDLRPLGVSEASVSFERAGVAGDVGVALIAGTGSSCTGRSQYGATAGAGGWGAVLGDDGSAYFIGRSAIRRVLAAEEGSASPTLLRQKMLDHFNVVTPRAIIGVFAGTKVNQTLAASFARKVTEAAIEGDEPAAELLRSAGRELAHTALGVAGQIFTRQDEFPLVLAGGVFHAGEILIEQIRQPFAQAYPRCRIAIAEMQPGEAVARLVRRTYYGRSEC